jgi:hypothetical protein
MDGSHACKKPKSSLEFVAAADWRRDLESEALRDSATTACLLQLSTSKFVFILVPRQVNSPVFLEI